jgi:tetratricopeptide (TPR) repeat protein
MADLLIEQLCQILAEKLQVAPTAGMNDLIAYMGDAVESDVMLKTALTERAVQINQGDARGYQVLVEGGRAYIGEHLHISDPSLVEAALNAILNAYASKPVRTSSNLPLSGVVRFIGRDEDLTTVHEKLQQTTTVAITSVSGMGGVGKTELALQYSYGKLREDAYPGGICWIQARSQDIGIGILDFARIQLGLPQPPEQLQTVPQQVKWVCERWRGEPILIVLDDVTDYAAVEPSLQQLDPRFRVLMTTRLKLGSPAQRLELEVLTEEASLELLRVLVDDTERINSQLEDAERLCEWLGRLPLGLELVGRYLARKQDLSLAQMLERLEAKKLEARALVQTEEQTQKITAKLGVAAAFQLTWEEKDFPNEARVLCGLLSVFALAPIPWKLVEQCLPSWNEEDLEDYRDDQLLGRSLLSRVGQERYQLHQLIREFFVVKLETELSNAAETLQRNFAKVLTAVAKTIPDVVTLDVIAQVEDALIHMTVVAEVLIDLLDDDIKTWSLIGLAWVAEAQSRWQDAEKWLKQALQIRETQSDHPNTAISLSNLAALYDKMSHHSEAEHLYQRALQICETQFGSNHPQTATTLNNLGELYRKTGCYSQAEPLYRRALQIREIQLGSNHPQTATCLNNLALLHQVMGRYSEAEQWLKQALRIREAQLGSSHPHTAQSIRNLAVVYQYIGHYSKAEPLFQQALQIQETQLGNDHPDTASTLSSLAALYLLNGDYSKAEPLVQRALQIREIQLVSDHPDTATTLSNLAEFYRVMRRYDEAESLYQRALQIWEAQLGKEHPSTAQGFRNLAALYHSMRRYDEAESLYQRALQIWETQLGREHPSTAQVLSDLAALHYSLGHYSKAELLYKRSLQIYETQLGSKHPHIATTLNNLAELYREIGRCSEAESLYKRSLQIDETQLDSDHPSTATTLNNLALLYQAMGRYNEAEPLMSRALVITEQKLGIAHPTTMKFRQNLATLLRIMSVGAKYKDALY